MKFRDTKNGRFFFPIALAIASLTSPTTCAAQRLGLPEVYLAALNHDPAYRAALAARDAAMEERIIGRSQLLPVISAVASTERSRSRANERETLLSSTNSATVNTSNTSSESSTTTDSTGDLFSNTSSRNSSRRVSESEIASVSSQSSSDEQFLESGRVRSTSASIQLRQPIINFGASAAYRQGQALTASAEARLRAQKQELMVRVAETYAQTLFSMNSLQLAQTQLQTLTEQLTANERMLSGGEGTITDLVETKAKWQLVQAQLIEAEDSLSVARNRLQAMSGITITELAPLLSTNLPSSLMSRRFEEWRQIALTNNGLLESLQYQVDASNEEVKKMESGHYPRLDLVASFGRSETVTSVRAAAAVGSASNRDASSTSTGSSSTSETSFSGPGSGSNTTTSSSSSGTEQTTSSNSATSTVYRDDRNRRNAINRSIGLELNIPLFAGGSTSARVRQAAARMQQGLAEKDAKTEEVLLELQRQMRLQESTVKRVRALELAVESSRIAIDATQKSMLAGVRTNLDVLNAKERLASAERDLASARYSHLLTYLRLRFHAGVLTEDDLVAVSSR
jgi:outer membrane protein, protease secretion system